MSGWPSPGLSRHLPEFALISAPAGPVSHCWLKAVRDLLHRCGMTTPLASRPCTSKHRPARPAILSPKILNAWSAVPAQAADRAVWPGIPLKEPHCPATPDRSDRLVSTQFSKPVELHTATPTLRPVP